MRLSLAWSSRPILASRVSPATEQHSAQGRERRPSAVGTALATVSGSLYLVFGTLVMAIVAFALSWIPPRGRLFMWFARLWSRGVLFFSGCRLEVEHEGGLDRSASYIFMANHQSLFDIPALLIGAPVDTRFMAKRSLFLLPFFGWGLWAAGFVSIDRKSRSRSQSGFASALKALRSGTSILIFPEGTRSLDGRLLPLKRGGLLLALRGALPIVPVGIAGSLGIRSRRSYLIRPGTVRIRYGRPIEPGAYGAGAVARLEAELRTRISELAGLD